MVGSAQSRASTRLGSGQAGNNRVVVAGPLWSLLEADACMLVEFFEVDRIGFLIRVSKGGLGVL